MPRKPPAASTAKKHVMGDHTLFHNASTAKRFPMIRKVPQHELAAMFNVPIVDPYEAKRREVELYSEPYNDTAYNFRPRTTVEKAFRPVNAAEAKEAVKRKVGDLEEEVSQRRAQSRERMPPIRRENEPPKFRFGSAADAQRGIERRYYLGSLDEQQQQMLQARMVLQIAENKKALGASHSSSRRRSPKPPTSTQ